MGNMNIVDVDITMIQLEQSIRGSWESLSKLVDINLPTTMTGRVYVTLLEGKYQP